MGRVNYNFHFGNMVNTRGTKKGLTWVVGTLVIEIFEKLGFWSQTKIGLNKGYFGSF